MQVAQPPPQTPPPVGSGGTPPRRLDARAFGARYSAPHLRLKDDLCFRLLLGPSCRYYCYCCHVIRYSYVQRISHSRVLFFYLSSLFSLLICVNVNLLDKSQHNYGSESVTSFNLTSSSSSS